MLEVAVTILIIPVVFVLGLWTGTQIKPRPAPQIKVDVPEILVTLERPEAKVIYKSLEKPASKKEAEEMTEEYTHFNNVIQEELNNILGVEKKKEE